MGDGRMGDSFIGDVSSSSSNPGPGSDMNVSEPGGVGMRAQLLGLANKSGVFVWGCVDSKTSGSPRVGWLEREAERLGRVGTRTGRLWSGEEEPFVIDEGDPLEMGVGEPLESTKDRRLLSLGWSRSMLWTLLGDPSGPGIPPKLLRCGSIGMLEILTQFCLRCPDALLESTDPVDKRLAEKDGWLLD